MTELANLKTEIFTDRLEALKTKLGAEENLARSDLVSTLSQIEINHDVGGIFEKLGTDGKDKEETQGFSLASLGRSVKRELWDSLIGRVIVVGLAVETVAEVIKKGPVDASEAFATFLNNTVKWAGQNIDKPDVLPVVVGVSGAIVYAFIQPKIYEIIAKREGLKTAKTVTDEAQQREVTNAELQNLAEGRAELAGKIGANIQIDVGKSDPSASLLIDLFHFSGLEVVTYWDQINAHFNKNHYWQRTNNDWTNRETLIKGDVQEAQCSVILVSNGDDVFLSSRPNPTTQDMTDNEAIGIINARNAIRRKMKLPNIQHILVTNPHRIIPIDVAGGGGEPYKTKTVGQVIKEKYPDVHLIDPDQLMIQELTLIANKGNLPLELVTNPDRKIEYQSNLEKGIDEYNKVVEKGSEKNKTKIAIKADGKNTLSIIYGSTDEDTIAQTETYREQFLEAGDMVVLINDPEKVGRLPEGTKYICIGTIVAEAVYGEFSKLVASGAIKI